MPLAAVIVSVIAGVLIPRLDAHVDHSLPGWLSSLMFGGNPGAARTVLDAVSSSLITVTSLTFSLTVVTLQLASSQFSPRLLRTFTSDVFVQATLATFLATFTFSLTVLRGVRGGSDAVAFVPRISVTVSFLLAVASVIGLVLFLAHLARQIRVETMLREVHQDATATIGAVLGDQQEQEAAFVPEVPPNAVRLLVPQSGFVVGFDESDLLSAANKAGAVVVLDCHPGSSLVEGTPMGHAWPGSGSLSDDTLTQLRRGIDKAVRIGFERTASQDIGYGLRQLTDVANKALSPGINDPTTAIHALGHVAALLCELSERDLGPRVLKDPDSGARVILRRPDFTSLVDGSLTQPRRYGSSDPQVMERLFLLLEQLAWRVTREDRRGDIIDQLARLERTVDKADFDETERDQLAHAAGAVRAALNHPVDRQEPS